MNTPQSKNGNLSDEQIKHLARLFVAYLNRHVTAEELLAEMKRTVDPQAAILADEVFYIDNELVRVNELAEV